MAFGRRFDLHQFDVLGSSLFDGVNLVNRYSVYRSKVRVSGGECNGYYWHLVLIPEHIFRTEGVR